MDFIDWFCNPWHQAMVLVVSASLFIGGVIWIKSGGGKPIKWLPCAPSYALTCLFGAAWNAVIVKSLWATIFCVVLAGLFKLGDNWSYRKQTWAVVGVVFGLGMVLEVWAAKTYGLR